MPELPLPARFVGGELLGRGRGSEVYRAHDEVLGRSVAVKLFHPDPDPLTRQRLDREGQALARLGHPGLVTVYDCGVHADRPYLVLQLIEGRTLQARLLAGPLPTNRVLDLGAALADALTHVHTRGVVHRDVKPANVFLDEQDQPHLGDFGIALILGGARLTSTSEIVGTPAYLAPEQVRGDAIGPAADIYALGLVLLECLTGEMEYPADVKIESAFARLHRPPRIPAGLSAPLAELLRAMTADQPGRRPTARRCAQELRLLAAGDTERIPTPRHSPGHRRALVVAGATGVAAAVIAAVLLTVDPAPPVTANHADANTSSPTASTSAGPSVPPARILAPPPEQPVADVTTHLPTHAPPGQAPVKAPGPPAAPAASKVPPGHGGPNPGKGHGHRQ